jgi:hypothetical protein
MKLKMAFAICAAAAICMSGWESLSGQSPATREAPATPQAGAELSYSQSYSTPMGIMHRGNPTPVALDDSGIQDAVQMYRDAQDDDGRKEATKAMSAALSNYFDADMKLREQEILDIEARVKKLQAQLARRSEAKAELLDLQLKVLVNEAEGLGFYGRASSVDNPFFSGGSGFGGGFASPGAFGTRGATGIAPPPAIPVRPTEKR